MSESGSFPDIFHPTWSKSVCVLVVATVAFFLPQEAPLEWYPLNDPGPDINLLEITCAADKNGEVEVFYDTGMGFNDLESIRIPVAATKDPYTYTFPLPDAPLFGLRLDRFLSDPAQATITNLRIINRRNEVIRHFAGRPLENVAAPRSDSRGADWELLAVPNDLQAVLCFPRPLISQGMNRRNLQRCLLSTGYLTGMLALLLLMLHLIFTRSSSWRAFLVSAGFLLFLSVCFSCVGNRRTIKSSLHYAHITASISAAAKPEHASGVSNELQTLLRAGAQTGGVLGTGWYDQETGFRWTAKQAHATFKSGPTGKLVIKGNMPDITAPNLMTLRANGRTLHSQELPAGGFTVECTVEPCALIGLVIVLQTAFVPKEKNINDDARELGAAVTDIFSH